MNAAYFFSMLRLSTASIIPYAIGCYLPYWDRLKIRRFWLLALLSGLFILETLFFNFFSDDGTSDPVFFAVCLLDLVVYLKTVDAPAAQLSFCFLLFIQFGAIIRGISFFVQISLFESYTFFAFTEAQASVLERFFYLVEAVFAMVVIIPLSRILKRYFVSLMDAVDMRQWRVLFILPLVFITLILVVATLLQEELNNPVYLFLLLLIALGSAFIYFIVFLLLRGIADNAALREQNLELRFREQYYSLLSEQVETTKRTRHDLRHHLQLLSGYLENQDYASAMAYLKEYANAAAREEAVSYCANPAVNLILNHYENLAACCAIELNVDARLPEQLFIPTSDVCVLLGNILENAVEGCQRQESGKKWVQVSLMADDNKLAAAIDNSCGKTRQGRNGRFISTKNGRKGIGLSSLSALAKKYDGSAWFEESDGVFKSSVVLHASVPGA